MKQPVSPSIIAGEICTLQQMLDWENAVNKRSGMKVRHLFISEYNLALNKNYNENLNFFKQNITPFAKQILQHIPFKDIFAKFLYKKSKLWSYHKLYEKPLDFELSSKLPYGCLYLTPFFLDLKYEGLQVPEFLKIKNKKKVQFYYDKNDTKKIENLKYLKSYGYKPLRVNKVSLNSSRWRKTTKGLKQRGKHYEI